MRKLFFLFFVFSGALLADPRIVYLSLCNNASEEIFIHWVEKKQTKPFTLLYRKEGDEDWKRAAVTSQSFLGTSAFLVKHTLLTGLEPATYYQFQFEKGSEIYLFRTLSSTLDSPIKIGIGGDFTESFSLFKKMNKIASQKNPDFVVLGGDIAYACGKGIRAGKHGSISKWFDFFDEWKVSMRGEKGRMIPVVPVVGNHDVNSLDRRQKGENSLFLSFFAQNLTYQSIDVTREISLFLLDTGHLFPIEEQTSWLDQILQTKKQVRWKIPVYHLAGYPSTYNPKGHVASEVRSSWVPLFEKYGVKFVFENHNHSFKRTYPMFSEKIDSKGIVYIGDGCWGAGPRKNQSDKFYLEKTASVNHFSLLTLEKDRAEVVVLDIKNEEIDRWESKD